MSGALFQVYRLVFKIALMVDDLALLERRKSVCFIGFSATLPIGHWRSASWGQKGLQRLYVQLPVIYSNDDWEG